MIYELLVFDRDTSLEILQSSLQFFRNSYYYSSNDPIINPVASIGDPVLFSGFTSEYPKDDSTYITLRSFFGWKQDTNRVRELRLVIDRIYDYLLGSDTVHYYSLTPEDKVNINEYLSEVRDRMFQDFIYISLYFPDIDLSKLIKDDIYLVSCIKECMGTYSVQQLSDIILKIMLSIKEPPIDWKVNDLTEEDISGKVIMLINRSSLVFEYSLIVGILKNVFGCSIYRLEFNLFS